jgi:hypothetical protein
MDRKVTYLALILALISLVISVFLLVQFYGNEALTERLDRLESQAATRQVEIQSEMDTLAEEASWEFKMFQARGFLVQAQIAMQLGENWSRAMESVESAENTLEEARFSAEPEVQVRINQILEELEIIKESIAQESMEADDQIQALLRDWDITPVPED